MYPVRGMATPRYMCVLDQLKLNHFLIAGACNDTLTAGLRDDQFTATSAFTTTYQASEARHGGGGNVALSSQCGLCRVLRVLVKYVHACT